ncbi:MAPEG family protein [Parablastomonas sp. CN1-191]|uniref:MAPEG family protein n=1 Tax=Parablastomonas sp. CN1-191 TaxID=3400908 RepID=UPI003BF87533
MLTGILLPTTLAMAAAAALLNIWMSIRIGRIRRAEKIGVGDGGHELLGRRMRAQLNFAENTPWVLALVLTIELAGKGGQWLPLVAAAYVAGRVAHALGMDGAGFAAGRMIGTITTMLTQVGLALVAAAILAGLL